MKRYFTCFGFKASSIEEFDDYKKAKFNYDNLVEAGVGYVELGEIVEDENGTKVTQLHFEENRLR